MQNLLENSIINMMQINASKERRQFMSNELSKEDLQKALNAHYKLSIEQHDPYYQIFVKLGADPNTGNGIGISEKVLERDLEAVKFLHSYGADLTPGLVIAIKEGLVEYAEYFLQNGARPAKWEVEPAVKYQDIPMLELLHKYHVKIADRLKPAVKELGIDWDEEIA